MKLASKHQQDPEFPRFVAPPTRRAFESLGSSYKVTSNCDPLIDVTGGRKSDTSWSEPLELDIGLPYV
jgi:hypothetical protein